MQSDDGALIDNTTALDAWKDITPRAHRHSGAVT